MVQDRRIALLEIARISKMAISYMIWFPIVTRLIQLGFLDLLAKHLKIYINLIVPCGSCQIPALGTEERWKTQSLKIFKR
jgi:hypothetical protein